MLAKQSSSAVAKDCGFSKQAVQAMSTKQKINTFFSTGFTDDKENTPLELAGTSARPEMTRQPDGEAARAGEQEPAQRVAEQERSGLFSNPLQETLISSRFSNREEGGDQLIGKQPQASKPGTFSKPTEGVVEDLCGLSQAQLIAKAGVSPK